MLFSPPSVLPDTSPRERGDIRGASEREKLFERLKSLQKGVHAITAEVYQERHLSMLEKDIRSRGTLILKQPNLFRWETSDPGQSVTVFDGETLIVYRPLMEEAEVYKVSEDIFTRNALRFFSSIMWGSIDEMEKRFALEIARRKGQIVFTLKPLSEMVERYLSYITIYYNENTGLPERFDMATPRGDRTRTTLSRIETNPEVESGSFPLRLPENVWITNIVEDEEF